MQNSQYYLKYLKYKQKYLKLKQQGGEPVSDLKNALYIKFATEKLIDPNPFKIDRSEPASASSSRKAIKRTPRETRPPSHYADYTMNLTRAALGHLSPASRSRMMDDIELDDKIIKTLEELQETEDPEYVAYENYGKIIEAWIADNMCCPACRAPKSLRRYANNSMPVIDLVCINPEHKFRHGVRFFQVKTSDGSLFADKPYFNYNPLLDTSDSNTIHVGSRTYGELVHSISPSESSFDKKILCGYICIKYTKLTHVLQIDPRKSMIVLPKYLYIPTSIRKTLTFGSSVDVPEDGSQAWYYCYTDQNSGHNRIKFNLVTNQVLTDGKFSDLLSGLTIDNLHTIETAVIENPVQYL